jgi:excisionase family DNA binding protein
VYNVHVLVLNIYKERQNKMEEILTTDEATKYLKITKRTLFKMVKEGKVRAMMAGNAYRFKKNELDEDLKVNFEEAKAAMR